MNDTTMTQNSVYGRGAAKKILRRGIICRKVGQMSAVALERDPGRLEYAVFYRIAGQADVSTDTSLAFDVLAMLFLRCEPRCPIPAPPPCSTYLAPVEANFSVHGGSRPNRAYDLFRGQVRHVSQSAVPRCGTDVFCAAMNGQDQDERISAPVQKVLPDGKAADPRLVEVHKDHIGGRGQGRFHLCPTPKAGSPRL